MNETQFYNERPQNGIVFSYSNVFLYILLYCDNDDDDDCYMKETDTKTAYFHSILFLFSPNVQRYILEQTHIACYYTVLQFCH